MSKKILLADDSLTIQKVVELTLAGTEYGLTCVSNGQKALETLQDSRPDLILADVVMPGKNGYEVCEAIRSDPATARIPVILLSGTFEPFDRDRADRVGADQVVSKPFDAQHLLGEIQTLLARAASASSPTSASEQGPFDVVFLDETAPTARAGGSIEPEKSFEHLFSEAEPAEGEAPPTAEAIPETAHEASAGPDSNESSLQTRASPEEAESRHPVEEAPAPESPHAEPSPEPAGVEEASAEAAEVSFAAPAAPPPSPPASPPPAVTELTQEQIERIAALVVAKLSDRVLREIAREVVPDVAEMVVKRRIEELESGAE